MNFLRIRRVPSLVAGLALLAVVLLLVASFLQPSAHAFTLSQLTPAERTDVERMVDQARRRMDKDAAELKRKEGTPTYDLFLGSHYKSLLTAAELGFGGIWAKAELVRDTQEQMKSRGETHELKQRLHWARVWVVANDQILDMRIAKLRQMAERHPAIAEKHRLVPSNSKPFAFPQATQEGRKFSLPGRRITIPTKPPIHVVDAGLPAYRLWRDCLYARTGGPNTEARDHVHCQDLDPKGRLVFDSDLAIFGR